MRRKHLLLYRETLEAEANDSLAFLGDFDPDRSPASKERCEARIAQLDDAALQSFVTHLACALRALGE